MTQLATFGTVSIGHLAQETRRSSSNPDLSVDFDRSAHGWEPSAELLENLPANFSLEMESWSGRDGMRRFVPPNGAIPFILEASLGGHAILQQMKGMSREQSFSYDAMRLIYQKAPKLQEKLCRSFRRAQDLRLSLPERFFPSEKDILPEDIGQWPDGKSRRWGVKALVENGREAAKEAGYSNPSPEQSIRYGLLEAAQRNPIDIEELSEEEVLRLVRISLFDFGPVEIASDRDEAIDAELSERVTERLLAAIEKHVEDDTEEFHKWFYEKNDNLVRQISKQKKNGGEIEREMVRQVQLETVFHAYQYIGDCVHLQLKAFADSLPEPLNEEERALFEVTYQKQACLGGLPLILLHDRFPLLKEIIGEIWNSPSDRRRWGVLLRLLYYHAEMVRNKRASERAYKRRKHHGNKKGQVALETDLPKELSEQDKSTSDTFQQVAADFRKDREVHCQCLTTDSWYAELDEGQLNETSGESVEWTDRCKKCGHEEPVEISGSNFQDFWQGRRE